MNNRKPLDAAFEKIANSKKVNLESQKVELDIEGDIKSLLKKAQSINNEVSKVDSKASSTVKTIKQTKSDLDLIKKTYLDVRSDVGKANKSLNKSFNKLYKAAKDIGVEPSKIPTYKVYVDAKKLLDKSSEEIQDIWESVAKYS